MDLEKLNEQQKQAVISSAKQLRIIAGAGSGKTRVLTSRIVYLIEEKGFYPSHILAITFTNKAANEMKNRIESMLQEKASGVWISTIHSLCLRILREDITALNYPRNFTICDSDDQKQILKEAYKSLNISKNEISYTTALSYISANKSEEIDPSQALKMTYGDEYQMRLAQIYDLYTKRLKQLYALDFDDLILWTIRLFEKDEDILFKWSNRFHHVLVDEFQDIDRQQYQLIKYLSKVHQNIYVVGDPDQTIYSWRGAKVDIIMNFNNDYPECETIILNRNYRSTNNILSAANSLITNNENRVEKDLYSSESDGQKVVHKTAFSDEGEAYFVLANINELVKNDEKYNDCAILYRSNYLSRPFEKVLIENHIPYVIYGGIRFYERKEIKDMLSYLRLLVQGDDLAFVRIVNTPKRGIGDSTIDKLRACANENNLTMLETLLEGKYSGASKFTGFLNQVKRWQKNLQEEDIEQVFTHILDESGYRAMLEKDNESERIENIKALLDDIVSYQKNYPDSNLAEYLQMISLYTDKETSDNGNHVFLMTVHAAKGLEFNNVFVVGLNEGIFPSVRTIEESGKAGLEEERRLAYVAFTRAKKRLYLSDNTSFSYVSKGNKTASRFLSEIDEEYLNDLSANNEVKREVEEGFSYSSYTNDSNTYSENPFSKGDIVEHDKFGEGVVIDIDGLFVNVAFKYPHGSKKILSTHPAIHSKVSQA